MSLEQKAKLSELSVWDDIERRRPSSPDSGILAMGWGGKLHTVVSDSKNILQPVRQKSSFSAGYCVRTGAIMEPPGSHAAI